MISGLVAALLAVSAPVALGVVNTCRAKNLTQATPLAASLQAVIDAADPGDKVAVRDVCVGNFTIANKLTLVGKATPQAPRAVLHANGEGRPVLVTARARLNNLEITGGDATGDHGGGIYNEVLRPLTLKDTVVRGNAAGYGGGISAGGNLTLDGASSVTGNTAAYGGGIWNGPRNTVTLNDSSSINANTATDAVGGINTFFGTLTLNDSSSVSGNIAIGFCGGVMNEGGTLILNDSSSVSGNTASLGGGIHNSGILTLRGSASVSGNSADGGGGGGIVNGGTVTLRDSSSVSGNTADEFGGGIYNRGDAALYGSSSVSGNTADADNGGGETGGGIFGWCGSTLTGAVEGGNVKDNYRGTGTPVGDDIAFETPCK